MKKNKLKILLVALAVMFIAFWCVVQVTNRNTYHMTVRQKILRTVYPLITWLAKSGKKNDTSLTNKNVKPNTSFYSLSSVLIDGKTFDFSSLRGKKVLIVNTASDCGYTAQYEELQKLYETYRDNLVVIGFPANDFKEQEKGSNQDIATFCKKNYGISFPLMEKSVVIKESTQHTVFKWLTDSSANGWNTQAPSWNFSKYLIDEAGVLINYFGPAISPLSSEVTKAIKGKI